MKGTLSGDSVWELKDRILGKVSVANWLKSNLLIILVTFDSN